MHKVVYFFIFGIRFNKPFTTWLCDRWKEDGARNSFSSLERIEILGLGLLVQVTNEARDQCNENCVLGFSGLGV